MPDILARLWDRIVPGVRARLKSLAVAALGASPLQYWPVTVRAGLAKGARWTAFPFSANWRQGGEPDLGDVVRAIGGVDGMSCWDLGAHFGIHTVGLACAAGSEGEVAAVEPDPVAFRKLMRHVRMNELRNVKTFQAAASRVDGSIELIVAGGLGSTVTHARYEGEVPSESTRRFNSPSIRLDTLVARSEVRLPDLIKVDVEGHGAKAIEGAIDSIAKSLPVIVFSVHSPHEWRDTAALLEPLSYTAASTANRKVDWEADPGPCTLVLRPHAS